jgi:nucleotide-binding universal stress UspA family protein
MDIRHILVPVDFGEASADALELSCELAAKLDAKLTLLHSFYVPPAAYGYAAMLWTADWSTASRAELESLAANTKRRHADTESVWLEGDPRLRILEIVSQRSVDLVVAGTHGRRGLSRLLFGSVASRLVRTSPVPLITTAAGQDHTSLRPRIRHILVATDFGDGAQQARELACGLATRLDARVTLLHVLPPTLPQLGRPMPAEFLPVDEAKVALAAELERVSQGVLKVDSILAEGDPREQILRIAADCNADLIAMGTHARRGLPRYLLGSVAEAVVRSSPIPVLTMTSENPASA